MSTREFRPWLGVALFASALLLFACQASPGAPPAQDATSGEEPDSGAISDPAIEAVLDQADEERLVERIQRERKERGRAKLQLAHDERAVQSAVRAIRRGAPPLPVLRTAMERLAESESSTVMGWSVEAEDLDQADVPSLFLEREEPLVAVVIVRRRSQPRYTIFYLLIEDGNAPDLQEG